MNRASVNNLTGVRFLAAGLVVLYHYMNSSEYVAPMFIKNIVKHGYIGVNFFYILSGYILSYNYSSISFQQSSSRLNFWRARFARVYPLYLLTFFSMSAIFISRAIGRNELADFFNLKNNLYMLFYLIGQQNWFVYFTGLLHVPSWSISCEIFFYFMFPFLIGYVEKVKGKISLMFFLWGGTLATTLLLKSLPVPGDWILVVKFTPLIHLPIFMMGMILGELQKKGAEIGALWFYFAIVFVVIALGFDLIPYILLHNGVLSPFFLIVMLHLTSTKNSFLNFIFSNRVSVYLGEISYSVYLIHGPIWLISYKLLPVRGYLFFIIYLIITILLSGICYRFVELPMRSLINKRIRFE